MRSTQSPRKGRERLAVAGLVAGLAATMAAVPLTSALAAETSPDPNLLEIENGQLSRHAGSESMVLLENSEESLPLAAPEQLANVAIFGVGSYATSKGGTGSADVNNRTTVNLRSGFEQAGYAVTTDQRYWDAVKTAFDARFTLSSRNIDYAAVEQPLSAETVQPTSATDTAVYIVTRGWTGGSDKSPGAGGFELNAVERANLELVAATYENVVVVLNTGSVFGTAFYDEINGTVSDVAGGPALDSLLMAGLPGQDVGGAIVDVLAGKVNPSGKLTDSWAAKYAFYPASATFSSADGVVDREEYSEGIYVGYRYFDSFYSELSETPDSVVPYPFGFGLSYTDFMTEPVAVEADAESVSVKVRVQNVGDVAGRSVAQVYFSAPQTGLDKPYQELAGFAKTDLLAPGESQTLTITYDTSEMTSYDTASSSWVLDPGAYAVRVGDSSRNTHVAGVLTLDARVTTEVNSPQLNDQQPAELLESDPTNFFTYEGENQEIADAPRVALAAQSFRAAVQAASPHEQNISVDSSSPYFAADGAMISSTTAYVPVGETDWEGTGAPYQPRTGESVTEVTTREGATLYDVAAGRMTMTEFVAGLNITELGNIVEGSNITGTVPQVVGPAAYTTPKYESLGIPSISLADGGTGLKITKVVNSTPPTYQYATAWPVSATLAQAWDLDLTRELARALAREMVQFDATTMLAPGLNIHRDPLGGRNWMYYSEDPLMTGMQGATYTEGVQETPGLGVTIKHFAANNQETGRSGSDSVGHERGLREIELKGFELAVKKAQPMAVMTGYNRLHGQFTAENYDLNTDILRGEWGFEGMVMSDWGGSSDAMRTQYAGNDLITPGSRPQDVIDRLASVPPTLELSGLPVYDKTVRLTGNPTYSWGFGGLRPAADGPETITTIVDQSTNLAAVPGSVTTVIDAMGNTVITTDPRFTSVNDAHARAEALLASAALTDAQKAAITIRDVVRQVPTDPTSPVLSYTIDIRGGYNTTFDMRLGDVQRSATNILNVVMQTRPFELLASQQGVTGVAVSSYSAQFDNLREYVTVEKEAVTPLFSDVPRGVQFYDEIQWLGLSGISTGWLQTDGTREYRPLNSIARDAMAAFLYRQAGSPAVQLPAASPFTDVDTDNQFYEEITWLSQQGISTGWDNGDGTYSFRPLEPIARDAMAAFLYRSANSPSFEVPANSPFQDMATSDQFYREVTWMQDTGIATGWEGNDGRDYYRPLAPVARDAMAAFLYRYHALQQD